MTSISFFPLNLVAVCKEKRKKARRNCGKSVVQSNILLASGCNLADISIVASCVFPAPSS